MSKAVISERPLIALFGSESAYRVLMYLENYGEGYASRIAKTFGFSLSQVQNQLRKFEDVGLLVSRPEAGARVFYFRPSPVTDALRVFLRDMLDRLPPEVQERYFRERRRPRRFDKR